MTQPAESRPYGAVRWNREGPGRGEQITRRRQSLGVSFATALTGALVLAGCGGPPPPTRTAISQPTISRSSEGLLTWQGLREPAVADTPLGLYFAWDTAPMGTAPVRDELAHVDRATGRVEAQRALGGGFGSAQAADGSLFVTTFTGSGSSIVETLVRLNPSTLAEVGHWEIRHAGPDFLGPGQTALAGGGLWVAGGDRLERFSLPRGRITASIRLPGAVASDVTADSAGTVLVVSEADHDGIGRIERRDPVTGGLLGISSPIGGVTVPFVDGVDGNDVWVSVPTGNMGYVELFDVPRMTPVGPPCNEGQSNPHCIDGTNAIRAWLVRGRLWVSQGAGGPQRNFCGEPGGQVLSVLPGIGAGSLLAIGRQSDVFFVLSPLLSPAKGGSPYRLYEEPIPQACR